MNQALREKLARGVHGSRKTSRLLAAQYPDLAPQALAAIEQRIKDTLRTQFSKTLPAHKVEAEIERILKIADTLDQQQSKNSTGLLQ